MDPGFRLDDRYRMERRVSRRGAAQVWRAHDELLARRVAVTLVGVRRSRRDLRRRLRDAARAAAALTHPNIVTTYDYGEAEGPGDDALTYVVTEFLSGESLAARLARGLPAAHEAVSVCAQLADALSAVHACGIVHGDLRPGQVFLTEDGVKLLGLGVTGATGGPGEEAGRAGDVLALGRILTECLTGDPESGPRSETAADVPAPAAPAGPADVEPPAELAERCRAAEPGDRPPAADVARAPASHAARTAVPPGEGAGGRGAARGVSRWCGLGRTRRAMLIGGAGAAVLAVVLTPLAVISVSLRDAPRGVAPPPLPSRPAAAPPAGSTPGPDGRSPAPSGPAAPADPPGLAAPAAGTREAAVSTLARMRRAIDVGMAEGEVGPRFGSDLATQVTTLMNEVDGGAPVDLGRRVARLRAELGGRGPHDVSPERAAGLSALLAEVPVQS
ncbi:protein kinase domain-containing protein [Actinomadura sp. 3N407]|uniref:protein kinase domain-containing protein n=1 Tax=Actinomadura sp. 3N407 TaxID=3457423 RepID=UPI003FCDE903